ncbi:MAG TPA: glycoside hydrolase family 9 protein, partial [Polyangiales bacterium]|nr:glycoside hydrolase family 9 protein [Polyangiales bacterium]
PALLVNQLGYLPNFAKVATLVSESATPLPWELLSASGETVANGQSEPLGDDAASGKRVHRVDFSSFTLPGEQYVLRVGEERSHPFAIRADVYKTLELDALAYFYHNRSGIEITLPFAREAQWTRPAGHLSDRSVPTAPGSGASYRLDVSGGWYDAGDHGKYVVNGGIAVWTLLDLYERTAALGDATAFADGRMRIPEAGNKVPDLLDEARVEVEWMLRMQVPEGKPLAGMVHHKLHGKAWSELGTRPDEDKMQRYLFPPSTAATLNLAAVAAQASRLFAPFDPAFSKKCLTAAERAWKASLAHKNIYAPNTSTVGGGPYDDNDVRDEQYWAAAELLVTTGKPEYRQAVERSPLHGKVATTLGAGAGDQGQHTAFTWQNVAAPGAIALALASDSKLADLQKGARASLVHAADDFLALRAHEGYHVPFAAGADGYPWGSNSFVLDNALVLGLAYDFTHDAKYADGAASALDYVLGENALDQSYVTGYGARPLQHPHHRFFAHQVRSDRPE